MIPSKKNKHSYFDEFLKESLKDPKVKEEYDKLQPEFALIRAMIDARARKGITQKKLATRMKTKQSVISRLESGRANPSLAFLKRLAQALNTNLEIKFTSK